MRRVRAAAQGMLTLDDSDDFIDDGGIIGIAVAECRVRFDVDLGAAASGCRPSC